MIQRSDAILPGAIEGGVAPGSSVAFDYFYLDAIEHPERYPDGQFLQPRGFALESNAHVDDLFRLHLAGANGHLLTCSGIVHVAVAGG